MSADGCGKGVGSRAVGYIRYVDLSSRVRTLGPRGFLQRYFEARV